MEITDREETLRKKIKLLIKTLYGYTDENNPFGDPNLSKVFIWHKKNQKYHSLCLDTTYLYDEQTLLLKLKNAKDEIDYLNKLRQERENSKAPKFQDDQSGIDWKAKDDSFLLTQEQLRTDIRIKQGREKPIDFLIKVLNIYKGNYQLPTNFLTLTAYKKPYEIFDIVINEEQLKDFYKDILFHKEINNEDKLYWNAMASLCEYYITRGLNDNKMINNEEVLSIINQQQTLDECEALEKEIKINIESEYKNEEVDFWRNVLEVLQIEKSKKIIDEMYKEFERKNKEKIQLLMNNNNDNGKGMNERNEGKDNVDDIGESYCDNNNNNLSPVLYESDEELRKMSITEHDYLFKMSENRKKILSYKLNQWQRNYLEETNAQKKIITNIQQQNSDDEVNTFISKITKNKQNKPHNIYTSNTNNNNISIPSTTNNNITYSSTNNSNNNNIFTSISSNPFLLRTTHQLGNDISIIKESRFDLQEEITHNSKDVIEEITHIESEELGDNENMFNEIVPISISYDWANKYKPIKPRYSNRVRIGYEWNKYNQAHYDFDNPPPKIIQGYKFNIFYPYLIDKTKTPEYTLERADCADMCIIRFHAGAPYEDIAFKIANREWDMTERAGFKNVFDKGILRLYFKFKRYRYKR